MHQAIDIRTRQVSQIEIRSGDIDGDGQPELISGYPIEHVTDFQNGAVEVRRGVVGGFEPDPSWILEGTVRLERLGNSLAVADFDQDGHADLVVGTGDGSHDVPQHAELYRGSPSGLESVPSWTAPADLRAGSFAYVSEAGDLDGDGFQDFVVFAPPAGGGSTSVVPFLGGISGPRRGSGLSLPSIYIEDAASVGDVDGDGHDDVAVAFDEAWYLLTGSTDGLAASPLSSLPMAPGFEISVAGLGDVDRDGFADVGISRVVNPGDDAVIHHGSPTGLLPPVALPLPPDARRVGHSIAAGGDLDGDGWLDVVGGGYLATTGPPLHALFAWFGGPRGFDSPPRLVRHTPLDWTTLHGRYPWPVGDVNGDGLDDIVQADNGWPEEFEVLLGQELNDPPHLLPLGDASAACGSVHLVATASDPNGDPLVATWTTTCAGRLDAVAGGFEAMLTTDGSCADACSVTVTVDDGRCGQAGATSAITVADVIPPALSLAPADVIVSCAGVPAAPSVVAEDDCAGAVPVAFDEVRVDGACPGSYRLVRRWSAGDDCGNLVEHAAVVEVVDDVAPELDESDRVLHCAWPPNGRWLTLPLSDWHASVRDVCDPAPLVEIVGCAVHEDGIADGELAGDCSTTADAVRLRVRRSGDALSGRSVDVMVRAVDACGNASSVKRLGRVLVPHDMRPGKRCD